jgi:hypothetical protein
MLTRNPQTENQGSEVRKNDDQGKGEIGIMYLSPKTEDHARSLNQRAQKGRQNCDPNPLRI